MVGTIRVQDTMLINKVTGNVLEVGVEVIAQLLNVIGMDT